MINIFKVIPKGIIQQVQFDRFLIGNIPPKYTSQIINQLKKYQLQGLNSLKRVKKIQGKDYVKIILCHVKEKDKILDFLKQFQQIIITINEEQLPINSPTTKQQLKIWSKYWPTSLIQPHIVKQIQHNNEQIALISQIYESKQSIILFSDFMILLCEQGECQPSTINHPIMRLLQKWTKTDIFLSKRNTPQQYYYLTGLRMLINKKICGMCCMALVHSRLQRVYLPQNLITNIMQQIFYQKKLNHKIIMFKIIQKN